MSAQSPIEPIRENLDLAFSPLDGGYFFQTYRQGLRLVSQTFATWDEAIAGIGIIEWEDPESEPECDQFRSLWRWVWDLELNQNVRLIGDKRGDFQLFVEVW